MSNDPTVVTVEIRDNPEGSVAFAVMPIEPETEMEGLRAQVEALRKALEPFASYNGSDQFLASDASDDGLCAAVSFTAGDYRRARAALGQTEGHSTPAEESGDNPVVPALLEALKGMVDAYWRGSEDSDDEHAPAAVKAAIAAIARAEVNG